MEYHVGEYVVHEGSGVCKIVDIDDMELMGKGSKKTYYIMNPVFKAGATVYSPIEGASLKLRAVATRDEFTRILDNIDNINIIEEPNDRARAELFKEAIGVFTPESLAMVVKTVLIREWARLASGKKIMAQDEKTLSVAGRKLYEEMAFSMDLDVKEVENIFQERVKEHSQTLVSQLA